MKKEMEIVERLEKAIEELNEVNENLRALHLIREKRESKRALEERIKRLEMSEEEYEEYLNSDENEVNISELVMDKGLYFELTEAYIKRDKLIAEIEELKDLSFKFYKIKGGQPRVEVDEEANRTFVFDFDFEEMCLELKEFSKKLNNYL